MHIEFLSTKHKIVVFLIMSLFYGSLAYGQSTTSAQMPSEYKSLNWTFGTEKPKTVTLCDVLEITLPEGFAVLDQQGTQHLNRLTENPETDECATIAPIDVNWFAMFQYVKTGYVTTQDTLNAAKLLTTIREAIDAGNAERLMQGWTPLELVGWGEKPQYDQDHHQLSWSIILKSDGMTIVNYETRLLGREGFIEVVLAATPEALPEAIAQFNRLSSQMKYVTGKSYNDFKQGDKVSPCKHSDLIASTCQTD